MKIGIVCPYNLAQPGGVKEHIFEQAAELRRRGYEIKIITPRPRGDFMSEDPPDVLFVGTSTRIKTPQHTSVDVAISVTTEVIDEVLAREKFDIVHMHEPLVPILARQMLPRILCPVVGTFHAAIPETALGKSIAGSISPFIRSIVKHLSAITAVSPAATSYISNYVEIEDIRFVPNGVDLVKYHVPNHDDTARKDILFVGRLEKRKGARHLIEAFALLHTLMPKVKLIIAGDGPDREKLEHYVHDLELEGSVSFLGFIDDTTKQKLMRQTALFVSPALYGESFGIVLIEAMASGAPVMGGFNPGYAFVMQGRGSLGLIDPENAELFANRMQIFLEDPLLRKMCQEWAAEEVKKYSYKTIVDKYEEIYKELAPKKKK